MTASIDCRIRRWRVAGLTVSSILAAQAGWAAADAQPKSAADPIAAGAGEVQEIVVTGRYEFLSVDTSGTTNLPIPIEQVPQSISLVSGDFLRAADLKTLGQIAEYTPGAVNAGQVGEAVKISLRGFIPQLAIDGINAGAAAGADFEPDYAIFDRVEIVKGPSSVVYGISSSGGLVNYITKSAARRTPSYVTLQAGRWSNYRFEGQVAGSLNSEGTVRGIAIGVRDQGKSFLDHMQHGNTTLYGGIDADWGSALKAYLHGGYDRHQYTILDGNPTFADGTPPPIPRSFCVCSDKDRITATAYHVESGLTWSATPMLDLSLKGNFHKVDSSGNYNYSYGLQRNGDLTLTGLYMSTYDNQDAGVSVSAMYRFDDLGLKKSFLSFNAQYQDSQKNVQYGTYVFPNGHGATTVNIFDGDAAISRAVDTATRGSLFPLTEQHVKALTASGQSILQLTDPLALLLGVSLSRPEIISTTGGVSDHFKPSTQTSYRAGLTYEFLPSTTGYLSFSESYEPQAKLDVAGKVLPPLLGTQYEAGIKRRSLNGRLLLTGAVFQITQKNEGEFAQLVGGFDRYFAVGEVRHRGLELSALGQINSQWQLNAGYSYLDPKITKDADPAISGRTRTFIPKQTLSAFSTYTFNVGESQKLTVGGGVRYVGAQRTSLDATTADLPGYALLDATVSYGFDDWLLQLNARNILDKHYFINNYNTLLYGNTPGTPADVAVSIRRTF